jgi:hypothetical protein
MTENQQINAKLTAARTELARTRHHREAMAIAERRGELIEKRLVQRQASYIFVTLRQAILTFPSRYSRRMVGLPNEHTARQVLTKAAHEFLEELASFPDRITDPGWMKTSNRMVKARRLAFAHRPERRSGQSRSAPSAGEPRRPRRCASFGLRGAPVRTPRKRSPPCKSRLKTASFFAISGLKDRLEVKIGGQHDHVANGHPAWPCQHEHHHIGHLACFDQAA